MSPPVERAVIPNTGSATQPTDIPTTFVEQIHPMQSPPASSTPVEMTKFDGPPAPDNVPLQNISPLLQPQSSEISDAPLKGREPNINDTAPHLSNKPSALESLTNASANPSEVPTSTPAQNLTRQKTVPAIGPSTEKPTPLPQEPEILGPILLITLLLTNGARHPYKIDEKYLKKRNVNVDDNNPVNMSTYTLKELIWREWREEWEARPSSPSSIRLIYYGKLLDDKMRLHDGKFAVGPTTHVVHMTVKPQDIVDEEDAKLKSGGRDRDGSERSHGCRCVIL